MSTQLNKDIIWRCFEEAVGRKKVDLTEQLFILRSTELSENVSKKMPFGVDSL